MDNRGEWQKSERESRESVLLSRLDDDDDLLVRSMKREYMEEADIDRNIDW